MSLRNVPLGSNVKWLLLSGWFSFSTVDQTPFCTCWILYFCLNFFSNYLFSFHSQGIGEQKQCPPILLYLFSNRTLLLLFFFQKTLLPRCLLCSSFYRSYLSHSLSTEESRDIWKWDAIMGETLGMKRLRNLIPNQNSCCTKEWGLRDFRKWLTDFLLRDLRVGAIIKVVRGSTIHAFRYSFSFVLIPFLYFVFFLNWFFYILLFLFLFLYLYFALKIILSKIISITYIG